MNHQGDNNNRDPDEWDLSRLDFDSEDIPDDFDEFVREQDADEIHLRVVSGIDEDKYRTRSAWLTYLTRLTALVALLFFFSVFVAPSVIEGVGTFLSRPKGGDYVDSLSSAGPPLRFERSEIKYSIMYPEHANQAMINQLNPPLSRALASWSEPMGDRIKFVPASSDSTDDLLIKFVTELDSAGLASLRPGNEYRPQVFIRVDVEGQFPHVMMLETVACHEIGHALGIWGHSSWRGDVMYPITTRRTPSRRDIKTLKIIYGEDGD